MHGDMMKGGGTMKEETVIKETSMPRGGDRGGRRPPLDESGPKVMMSLRIAPRLKEKLDAIAKARGVPIVRVVEEWIEREPCPE